MSRRKDVALILTGAVLGASLVGGATAAGIIAEPTWQKIYVDGERVSMTAYNIAGSNYVVNALQLLNECLPTVTRLSGSVIVVNFPT